MKRFAALLAAFVIFIGCSAFLRLPVSAGEKGAGEVLYHQDFSVLSELEKSGIVRGTAGSENSEFTCTGDALELNTFDNERAYAILPPEYTERGDSWTVEFGFSFSEIVSGNGYVGFILTCRGTEPTNITALVIRADGTVDDFEEPDAALKKAIAGGREILVKIPIERNVLHKIELTADGKTYTLERENVKVIEDGGIGFAVRNASVEVSEIFLVEGTGYTEKYGIYSEDSYASDEAVTTVDTLLNGTAVGECLRDPGNGVCPETAPDTGICTVPWTAALAAAAVGLFRWRKPRR